MAYGEDSMRFHFSYKSEPNDQMQEQTIPIVTFQPNYLEFYLHNLIKAIINVVYSLSCLIKEILGEVIVEHLRVRCKMVWLVQPPGGRLLFLGGQRIRNKMKGTHGTRTSTWILACVSHHHFSPLNLVTITFQPRTHVKTETECYK